MYDKLLEIDTDHIADDGSPMSVWLDHIRKQGGYVYIALACAFTAYAGFTGLYLSWGYLHFFGILLLGVVGYHAFTFLYLIGYIFVIRIPEDVLDGQLEWQRRMKSDRQEMEQLNEKFLNIMQEYSNKDEHDPESDLLLEEAKETYRQMLKLEGLPDRLFDDAQTVLLRFSARTVDLLQDDGDILKVPDGILFFDFENKEFVTLEYDPDGLEEIPVRGTLYKKNGTVEDVLVSATYHIDIC